jgi:copper transporter 1
MLFTWDTTNLCVVFRWWHVRGPWSLLFTLLGVVVLGMSYEVLRHVARKYDESSSNIRLASPIQDEDDERGRRTPTPSGRYVAVSC